MPCGSLQQNAAGFVERKDDGLLAAIQSGLVEHWKTSEDFPQPAGPMTSVLVPRSSPPPSSKSSAASPMWLPRRW